MSDRWTTPATVGPKVAIVGPITVAWQAPGAMKYGGVERVAWRLTHLLAKAGYDVVAIGPADCSFMPSIARRSLWPHSSLLQPLRQPKIYSEDAPLALRNFAQHMVEVLENEQPDAIILLGPSAEILTAISAYCPSNLSRLVVALHNGPSDNVDTIPLLRTAVDVKLLALSDIQRRSFADLEARIEVVTDGIPVDAITYSPDPENARNSLLNDQDFGQLSANRRIISQVDYYHPNKGMLIALDIFNRAKMYRSHDLVLGGGMGWQLPSRQKSETLEIGIRYYEAIVEYVDRTGLDEHVHLLGGLSGKQTAKLMQASDLAISPVRMQHGSLWSPDISGPDYESYGQGRAIANAAGTPVLMSSKYDPSFTPANSPWLRFSSTTEGISAVSSYKAGSKEARRSEMRRFSEIRDDFRPAFARYTEIVSEIASRQGDDWYRPPAEIIREAADAVVALER